MSGERVTEEVSQRPQVMGAGSRAGSSVHNIFSSTSPGKHRRLPGGARAEKRHTDMVLPRRLPALPAHGAASVGPTGGSESIG